MPDSPQNNFAERVKIEIAEKNMKAFVTITAPAPEEEVKITPRIVHDLLEKAQVKFGIKKDAIQEIIDTERWDEKFLAAEGIPSTQGKDASLEYFFPTGVSMKPQIKEDGHVDYKEVDLVHSVSKDSILVKKTIATSGTDGTDVYGSRILALSGKNIDIKAGPGVYKDPADNTLIKASIDGIIFYNPENLLLEVQKLYVVPKSVDYSTGNIHVKSSVEIQADIKPDFSVSTPYNVEVKGVIENAVVTCDGILTVKVGIKGNKEKLIKTGGDIHAGYIQNAHIKCNGSIYAATEIRNSCIECADEVTLVRAGGVIIGGKVMAKNKVTAASIGNLYYVPTDIEVGLNFEFKEKFHEKECQIKAENKLLDELEKDIEAIENKPPDTVKGPSVSNLKSQKADHLKEIERLKNAIKEIEKEFYSVADPSISVSKTVYPGTIIKIKGVPFEVKEELSHVVFTLFGDKVIYTPLK